MGRGVNNGQMAGNPGNTNISKTPYRSARKEDINENNCIHGIHQWEITPLEKATDSCRWYKSFLINGGSMPPSIVVREHSSLTGFTAEAKIRFFCSKRGKDFQNILGFLDSWSLSKGENRMLY